MNKETDDAFEKMAQHFDKLREHVIEAYEKALENPKDGLITKLVAYKAEAKTWANAAKLLRLRAMVESVADSSVKLKRTNDG